MDKKLKLYNYIVKDFINRYCKFVEGRYQLKVYIYIDQYEIEEPFIFDIDEIEYDLENDFYDNIGKEWLGKENSSNPVTKGFEYVLGNYGLIGSEQYEVFRMIFKELIEIIKSKGSSSINESEDKRMMYYEYIVGVLLNDIYVDRGVFFRNRGFNVIVYDCLDFIELKSLPFNPKKHPLDNSLSNKISDFGVTDLEEQQIIYRMFLDEVEDKYCTSN